MCLLDPGCTGYSFTEEFNLGRWSDWILSYTLQTRVWSITQYSRTKLESMDSGIYHKFIPSSNLKPDSETTMQCKKISTRTCCINSPITQRIHLLGFSRDPLVYPVGYRTAVNLATAALCAVLRGTIVVPDVRLVSPRYRPLFTCMTFWDNQIDRPNLTLI